MTPVGDHGVQRAATGRSEGGEEPQSLGQHVTDMGKPTGGHEAHPGLRGGGSASPDTAAPAVPDTSPRHSHVRRLGNAAGPLAVCGEPAPQNALCPPAAQPGSQLVSEKHEDTAGKGLRTPPRCYTHFPRLHRATRGLASLPPPGRRDAARRRFPTRPGGELRPPAPKDEPPVDSDLAGAVGGRSGAGARAPRRGTPPAPAAAAVTGEEMREDPRCSRRCRERGYGGRRRAGTMRKQKMQVKHRLHRGLEGPAVRGGRPQPGGCPEPDNDPRGPSGQCEDTGARRRPGCSGASPALAFTDKAPRPLQPQLRPWHCTGRQRPEPAHRRARHDARTPGRTGAEQSVRPRAAQEPPRPSAQPPAPAFPPAAGYGRFPPARAYLAGPFPGPLRGTRPGSAPRRVPGSRRERALSRGSGGPSPGGSGGFSPGRAETALGTRGSPAPAPGAPRARPPHSPLAVTPPRPAPPGRPPPPRPRPPSFAIGDIASRPRLCCRLIGLHASAPPRAPRSRRHIGARRCHSARGAGGRPPAAPTRCGAGGLRQRPPGEPRYVPRGGAGGARSLGAGRLPRRDTWQNEGAVRGAAGALGGGGRRAPARRRRAGPAARHVRARGFEWEGGWAGGSRHGVPAGPPGAETAPARAGPAGPALPQLAGRRPWSPEQRPRGSKAEGRPLRGRRGGRAGQEGPRGARCPSSAQGLRPVPGPAYRGCGCPQ
ncbi:collagen alpha-1(I) chain-like [Zonotrichia leucophrys gambelii]|uniref:collagen alpha-1(I) chain-like n=1 Tax=Zonotrichia leucophrys gambelii TaxID=257770 RepID=UPI0031400AD3